MEIKFNFKKYSNNTENIYGIEIYREYSENKWGYIDMMHPMNKEELIKLKNSITRFIEKDSN